MSEPKSKSIKASPQHSPLPWRVAVAHSTQGEHRYIHSASYDQTGNSARFDSIASEDASPLSREKWDANAQLIVQAVNSHEAAREMAELAITISEGYRDGDDYWDDIKRIEPLVRKFQELDK